MLTISSNKIKYNRKYYKTYKTYKTYKIKVIINNIINNRNRNKIIL